MIIEGPVPRIIRMRQVLVLLVVVEVVKVLGGRQRRRWHGHRPPPTVGAVVIGLGKRGRGGGGRAGIIGGVTVVGAGGNRSLWGCASGRPSSSAETGPHRGGGGYCYIYASHEKMCSDDVRGRGKGSSVDRHPKLTPMGEVPHPWTGSLCLCIRPFGRRGVTVHITLAKTSLDFGKRIRYPYAV